MKNQTTIRKYIAPVIAIFVIIILVFTLIYFREFSPYKLSDRLIGNPRIILKLRDVVIVGRTHGAKSWSFKAKQAEVSKGRYRTEFVSITDGKLYNGDKIAARVAAGRAIYDSTSGNVEISEGIKVSSMLGYSAKTDKATWVGYFKTLRCPNKVHLSSSESRLTGENLVVNTKLEVMTMDNPRFVIDISDIKKLEKNDSEDRKGILQ